MSDSSSTISTEAVCQSEPHIKLTNKGMFVYRGWNRRQLLSLLQDKLLRRHNMEFLPVCNAAQCDTSPESWRSIIHSGIYNEHVLTRLEEKGMSPHDIMKAMKYGLLGFSHNELKDFQDRSAEDMHVLKDIDTWFKKLDKKLIWTLLATGLTEDQCWNIVMCGLTSQNKNVLCRLLSSGIDVPGILSWTSQIKLVTPTIIEFLKKLGIDENIIHYVEENGIDDEAGDMLDDLGYNEYEENEALAAVLCECSFTESKSLSVTSSSEIEVSDIHGSNEVPHTPTNTQHNTKFMCTCNLNSLSEKQDHKTLNRRDYLKQNVMVPLMWAINRTLEYKPLNPQHYIAYQLLRWKYKNASQEEIDDAQQFVASPMAAMDRKLLEERKEKTEITIKNIICDVCLERQKSSETKEHCRKCKKVPFRKE